MKKSKVMLVLALIFSASVLSGANTFAAPISNDGYIVIPDNGGRYYSYPYVDGLYLRNDQNLVQYRRPEEFNDELTSLIIKYEADPERQNSSQESNRESHEIKNPDTLDMSAIAVAVAGICLALFVLSLVFALASAAL